MWTGPSQILYVDDEPALLEIGKAFLERTGECTVQTSQSAYEALDSLHISRFDAIISDYQMPGMDGLEFLKSIRNDPHLKEIPFILFTGRGREEVVIAAINNGADFYLQKGGDPRSQFAELRHKIHQAIRRRQSEHEVIEKQSLISLAEKLTNSGIWTFDLKTGRGVFSEGLLKVFGVEKTEYPESFYFNDGIHPEDREREEETQRKLFNREIETSDDEFRIIYPDGTIRFIHAIRQIIDGPDGVSRIFGTAQDITDQKNREIERDQSHELYHSLIQASPDLIIIADLTGKILFASPLACEFFGLESESQAIGENITSWIIPEDHHLAFSCIAKHMQGEKAPPIIYRLIRRDSGICTVEIHSAPIHNPDGTISGIIALIRDSSEKIAQHEALERANTKLNLLSSITRHDILNKITALRLYCSLIEEEENPAQKNAMFRKVEEMTEIISNLVAFTGSYQNLGINTAQWISPGEVFEKITNMIDNNGECIINGFDSARILADPLFEKVLYNLLDNSIKYAKTLTTIQTGYELTSEGLILSFTDDGVGIPQELKERIFQRNFGQGTGLGLYLSREILSVTDLTIRETGTPGYGARFEIVVPVGKFQIRDKK